MIQNNLIEGVYDLHYIVSSVMADLGETDNSKFKQLLKWAIDGYRRINLAGTFGHTIKTARIKMGPSNSIDLPLDYVDYIKIGVCVNGYICNFDYHEDLCVGDGRVKKDACGDEEIIQTLKKVGEGRYSDLTNWGYLPYFHNGQYVKGFYGASEGFKGGGYKIDLRARKIYFSSCVEVDEVILEYKVKGIDSTGNAIVPETAISTLVAFIHWQRCKFTNNGKSITSSRMEAADFKREFQLEHKGMVRRKNAMNKQEWLSLIRSSIHQLPKR